MSPDDGWAVFATTVEGGRPDLYLSGAAVDGGAEPLRLPEPINSRWTEFAPGWGPIDALFPP